jgi:cellulose synthase/poly-beta-1,6-N-acetylglucosamine synthase-like glycosyltransferase
MRENIVVDIVEPVDITIQMMSASIHKVAVLVPVCNGESTIAQTIESLMAQTYPLEYVRVIANNCSDSTVEIVQMLQVKYESLGKPELQLLVMDHNEGKKSGALNYGFATIGDDIEFLFGMDDDTIVEEHMIEEGVKQFLDETMTGGICSAYRALPLKRDATHWERFLWRLQNIEFTLANAWRIENYKSARVLPGVSVMFRMESLIEVAALEVIIAKLTEEIEIKRGIKKAHSRKSVRKIRKRAIKNCQLYNRDLSALKRLIDNHDQPEVWATNNLVEDYHLTLDLKDLGWGVKSSADMISWSDVPLKLNGKGGLWSQRQRWYSGTVDEIRTRRLEKHSRYEIFTIFLLMLNLLMRFVLVSAYATLVIEGIPIRWVSVFLILPVLASISSLYRLKGGDQLDKWQIIFTGTLIVTELYAFYRELIYASSIWASFFRPNREW